MSQFSLFIPRVLSNITEKNIREVFLSLGYGIVSKVRFAKIENDETYNRAYVYFNYWFSNTFVAHFQAKLEAGQGEYIVYDMPRYWIVLKNRDELQEEEEDNEDNAMESILSEMDDAEEQMPEESTDTVSTDYVEMLEKENRLLKERLQKNDEKWEKCRDKTRYLLEEIKILRKKTFDFIREEENIVEREDFYRHNIRELELDRMELQTELAHYKEQHKRYEASQPFHYNVQYCMF